MRITYFCHASVKSQKHFSCFNSKQMLLKGLGHSGTFTLVCSVVYVTVLGENSSDYGRQYTHTDAAGKWWTQRNAARFLFLSSGFNHHTTPPICVLAFKRPRFHEALVFFRRFLLKTLVGLSVGFMVHREIRMKVFWSQSRIIIKANKQHSQAKLINLCLLMLHDKLRMRK